MPSVAASQALQSLEIIGVDSVPQTAPEGISKKYYQKRVAARARRQYKDNAFLLILFS